MNVIMYHGPKAERPEKLEQVRHAVEQVRLRNQTPAELKADRTPAELVSPVLITSYEILIKDEKELKKFRYSYMVFDDSPKIWQNSISNSGGFVNRVTVMKESRVLAAIKAIKQEVDCQHLLLARTPLQNDVNKLCSLWNFLFPWTSAFDLKAGYVYDSEMQEEVVPKLHQCLRPSIRRSSGSGPSGA